MTRISRFSAILGATVLLAAAAVLLMVVGMNRGEPGGELAYASDPSGTPIPLENPRIPPFDVVAPGSLSMLLEKSDTLQMSTIATSLGLKSTQPATPHLRFQNEKQFMLGLISEERRKAGVPEVILGSNNAAQIQTENANRDCVSGHWGTDGLGPPMRYSLAGGYQSNGENAAGWDYCLSSEEKSRYRAIESIEEELRSIMRGYMGSPGHRDNILYPLASKGESGTLVGYTPSVERSAFRGGLR